ncbi:MAG: hypothetical protein FJ211_03805 [Ignavibacteria bacterium]|nr:hypothetical protein [Ignavibacteria bacterium]
MRCILVFVLMLVPYLVFAQQGAGPDMPIILEHADSIVGAGQFESSSRTFYGNVRFQQGNVTGRCDRAIHNAAANSVELFGNVVVRQGRLTMYAPEVRYSGANYVATATKGIRVEQNGQTIEARRGVYSTNTHIAQFFEDVFMYDDSMRMWSDTMIVDRDDDTMRATGRVVGYDSSDRVWFESDLAQRDARTGSYALTNNARLWQWGNSGDTMFVSADTLDSRREPNGSARILDARGSAVLIKGPTCARSGRITYQERQALLQLDNEPYVWTDSMAFVAKAITASILEKRIESMTGAGQALLMSRVHNAIPARYDQIAGSVINLSFAQDTLRTILAAGDAQSITYRSDSTKQEGLAKVASDSLRAVFENGQLSDVYWLGGIAGEHHPERLVLGKETEFLLPRFSWRTDRPQMAQPNTKKLR